MVLTLAGRLPSLALSPRQASTPAASHLLPSESARPVCHSGSALPPGPFQARRPRHKARSPPPLPGLQPRAGPLLLSPGAGGAAAAGRVRAAARGAWTESRGASAPGAHTARARTPSPPRPRSPPRVQPAGPAAPPWPPSSWRPAGGRPGGLSPAPGPAPGWFRPNPRPWMRGVASVVSEAALLSRAGDGEGRRGFLLGPPSSQTLDVGGSRWKTGPHPC